VSSNDLEAFRFRNQSLHGRGQPSQPPVDRYGLVYLTIYAECI